MNKITDKSIISPEPMVLFVVVWFESRRIHIDVEPSRETRSLQIMQDYKEQLKKKVHVVVK